ncbi:hypothetical protein C2S52_004151 [Perilla frutescens var. hirtella]|nr:hypothetical protein C2S52_004151 [Perilla frutescens var. hirtella]
MEPEKLSNLSRAWLWFREIPSKLEAKLHEVGRQAIKIGKDDPRRVIHSLKVGLAVTLVSLLYYFQPLYNNFGVSAMWAIMTVIVVFEFSVGATIGKGINRGLASLAAAGLALGAHNLANLTGKTNEPYLIGLFVFIQAAAMTFIRFFPKVKARYDYGMLIFILTFCLVSISGFRANEVVKLAQARLLTILIGASTCLLVSILICPVWAGEDLHKFVAQNIHQLGHFLEVSCYLIHSCDGDAGIEMMTRPSTINLNNILVDSKTREETLANLAGWEPGHGEFMYRHPWKQYLKIGNLTRQCACRLQSLNGYLNSEFKAPQEIQWRIQEGFAESGKALKEAAWAVEAMAKPTSPNPHITNLKIASKNLQSSLKSVIIDTVSAVENIADAVDQLSFMAKFKTNSNVLIQGESEMESKENIGIIAEIPSLCIQIDGGDAHSVQSSCSN